MTRIQADIHSLTGVKSLRHSFGDSLLAFAARALSRTRACVRCNGTGGVMNRDVTRGTKCCPRCRGSRREP